MTQSAFHQVFLYDHVHHVMAIGDTFCTCRDNAPMNSNTLKIHKGIDNRLIFRALGPDRTPQNIACTQQVYGRIIDSDNRTIVLEKLCRLGPAKGIITLELDSGDIALLHAGFYQFVLIRTEDFVTGVPGYYVEKPLYSDLNDNVAMQLEITEQAFKAPLESVTFLPDDWTPDMIIPTFGPVITTYYTSRIPGARVLNHVASVHSFSTYTTNFTGILEIFGSLEETPDPYLSDFRWFKIYPSSQATDIEYVAYTGTQAWTFSANFMWLKFRLTPSSQVLNPGIMNKLIVRV